MKKILIASFDMEVGGVERSLVSMLNNFDYHRHRLDLMLYSHTGDFMNLLHHEANLLTESAAYKPFRMPIKQVLTSKYVPIGFARLLAKYKANRGLSSEVGYRQMQWMWSYALPFLPKLKKKYDVAISYLWPHYFVAEKVAATTKIAWIHTDFSTVDIDTEKDLSIWNRYDYVVAVSDECRSAFIKKFPLLRDKTIVIENITSPDIVCSLALEKMDHTMFHDKRFKLITVARLSHAKGIDRAIKSLALLRDR